jgi:ABC-2 type transport system permease protein
MLFFRSFSKAFSDELGAIKNSPYLLGLITWIPLLVYVLIILIFNQGLLREMPIAVVDSDRSELSRKVGFSLDASSSLHISHKTDSLLEASSLLRQSKIYGIIVIPPHFERNIYLNSQPKIEVMLNSQYILIGKSLNAAINASLQTLASQIDVVKNLAQTERFESAISSAVPIGLQVTPFFNTSQSYFPFLVSAIIPAIWQVFIVIAVIASIGIVFKRQEEETLFKDGNITATLLGKMLPYTVAFLLQGMLFLFYMYVYLPFTFEGSFAVTIFAMLLSVLAYQGIGLFLFVVGFDYARALSLGAVYTAPAFAFLGITFPKSDMPSFAQFWNEMLPIAHYMKLQIAQANYGTSIIEMLPILASITLFLLVWPLVIFRFKKHLEIV